MIEQFEKMLTALETPEGRRQIAVQMASQGMPPPTMEGFQEVFAAMEKPEAQMDDGGRLVPMPGPVDPLMMKSNLRGSSDGGDQNGR